MKEPSNSASPATATDTAGAVGVPESRNWYIAIVNHGSERASYQTLLRLGYECYLPTQTMTVRYANGRKKRRERLVLPAKIFIHTTEEDRLKHVVNLPFIFRFMTDPARRAHPEQRSPVAIVPDRDMDSFRLMLGQEDFPVSIEETPLTFAAGTPVRVAYGPLAGLEGSVAPGTKGENHLHVSLNLLGSAAVEIDARFLEPINHEG